MATLSKLKEFFFATTGAIIVALGIGKTAHATVLTFDELSPTYIPCDGMHPMSTCEGLGIPDGYGGFSWKNFYYLTTPIYYIPDTGYQRGTVSGTNVAYNGYGGIAKLNNSVFDFDSAYLTAAWNDDLFILVEGFLGGDRKYSNLIMVNTTAPTFFQFNFLGIDRLQFIPWGGTNVDPRGEGTQFVMDNLTFNEPRSTRDHEPRAVPEPTPTLGVFALGAFSSAFLVNRKRQHKGTGTNLGLRAKGTASNFGYLILQDCIPTLK